jgi:hypothetical protein
MTPSSGPITAFRSGAPSQVIQGFFPGGGPKIIQPSPTPMRPQVPAPVQARPVSPPAPMVPGRPANSALQPSLRPGQPPRPILPTKARSGAVQPATPVCPQAPQPILPQRATPTAEQPHAGNAFALPASFTLRPRGSGQPLPEPIQKKMESFFNTSFADVRVHVGYEAAAIGALAFTHGADLYFAPGQYNPQSTQGQQLLGHELTHVVQQRAGRVRNPLGAGIAVVQDPALEAEAERMGLRAASTPLLIQAKPAGTGPVAGSSQGAGLRPHTAAARGAILPARSQAEVAVQRKPGPTIPGKLPVSGNTYPGTFSSRESNIRHGVPGVPQRTVQRMEMSKEDQIRALAEVMIGEWGEADLLKNGWPFIKVCREFIERKKAADICTAEQLQKAVKELIRVRTPQLQQTLAKSKSNQTPKKTEHAKIKIEATMYILEIGKDKWKEGRIQHIKGGSGTHGNKPLSVNDHVEQVQWRCLVLPTGEGVNVALCIVINEWPCIAACLPFFRTVVASTDNPVSLVLFRVDPPTGEYGRDYNATKDDRGLVIIQNGGSHSHVWRPDTWTPGQINAILPNGIPGIEGL